MTAVNKETIEALDLLFTIADVLKEAKENDGVINFQDLPLAMKIFPKISPAMTDADKILEELKNFDLDNSKELQDYVAQRFGALIDKEKVINQVKLGIRALIANYQFAVSFK